MNSEGTTQMIPQFHVSVEMNTQAATTQEVGPYKQPEQAEHSTPSPLTLLLWGQGIAQKNEREDSDRTPLFIPPL